MVAALEAAFEEDIDLTGAVFDRMDLCAARAYGGRLSRASFRGAQLRAALAGARFEGADLTDSSFESADLHGHPGPDATCTSPTWRTPGSTARI